MLETQAEVVQVDGGVVSLKLNNPPCGGCNAACSATGSWHVGGIHLNSSEKVLPGKPAVISLPGRQLIFLSVLFYLSPLLGFFIGLLVGEWITAPFVPESTEMGALAGGALGLFLAFRHLSGWCSRVELPGIHMPTITPLR